MILVGVMKIAKDKIGVEGVKQECCSRCKLPLDVFSDGTYCLVGEHEMPKDIDKTKCESPDELMKASFGNVQKVCKMCAHDLLCYGDTNKTTDNADKGNCVVEYGGKRYHVIPCGANGIGYDGEKVLMPKWWSYITTYYGLREIKK